MAIVETQYLGSSTEGDRPAGRGGLRPLHDRLQLRLVIALPGMLVLFTACYGLISYSSFNEHWDGLKAAGAEDLAGNLLQTHLVAMLVLAVVAMLSGIGIAWAILKPINALMEATQLVARGRLGHHAPDIQAAPEIAALSRSFNRMIDELSSSIAARDRDLIEAIPLGILTTDLAGHVTAVNPLASSILQIPSERLTGRHVGALEPLVPDELRSTVRAIAGALGTHAGRDAGQPADSALSVAWLRDGDARATGAVFSFREPQAVKDLTAHLRRTDQLASLGTFALGLAHELRNPLAAVKGLSQILALERQMPERAADYLSRMSSEIDRVDRFVGELLKLSQHPLEAPRPVRLEELARQAATSARESLAHAPHATLTDELDSGVPLLLEPGRVGEALHQILQNAWRLTPPGGTITLRSLPRAAGAAAGIAVHNTGTTIAPHLRERIFEPFYSTAEQGTGLGLTFAREIIAQNGGTLVAEVDAQGVAFVVRFGSDRETSA